MSAKSRNEARKAARRTNSLARYIREIYGDLYTSRPIDTHRPRQTYQGSPYPPVINSGMALRNASERAAERAILAGEPWPEEPDGRD